MTNAAIALPASHRLPELVWDAEPAPRTCRVCGCTEAHACYRPDVGTCSWAAENLCTHCVAGVQLEEADRRRRAGKAACLTLAGLWIILILLANAPAIAGAVAPPRLRPSEPLPLLRHALTHPPGVRGAPWAANA